jgi:hypothetical protein
VFVEYFLSTTDAEGVKDLSNTHMVSCNMSIIRCRNPHVRGLKTRRMSVPRLVHELLQVFEDPKPDGFHSANVVGLYLSN